MTARFYFDTSVLRVLLIRQAATKVVTARFHEPGAILASSELTITELHRFALTVPSVSAWEVDQVLGELDLVAITAEQLRRAGLLPHLPAGVQLRSLDAIHVQAALDMGATEFLTSDKRQGKAAKAAGLTVKVL